MMRGEITPTAGVTWPPNLVILQAKLDVEGALRAMEWYKYDYLLKAHDPAAYQGRQDRFKRRRDFEAARRLSVKDLTAILAEKTAKPRGTRIKMPLTSSHGQGK